MQRHQNLFQNVAIQIFEFALKNGSEELLIKLLIKANILSDLKIAYQDLASNNACAKLLKAESFMMNLKKFVLSVQWIFKVKKIIIQKLFVRKEIF